MTYIKRQIEESNKHVHPAFWAGELRKYGDALRHIGAILYLSGFRDIKGLWFLDAGCREGKFMDLLKTMGCKNAIGFDVNPEALSIAQSKGHFALEADMQDATVFRAESFDVVTSIHSLEHVVDRQSALTNFHKVLKHGGLLYVEVPTTEEQQPPLSDLKAGNVYEIPFTEVELKSDIGSLFELLWFETMDKPAVAKLVAQKRKES